MLEDTESVALSEPEADCVAVADCELLSLIDKEALPEGLSDSEVLGVTVSDSDGERLLEWLVKVKV